MNRTALAVAVLLGAEAGTVVCALALPVFLKPARGLVTACRIVVAVSCAKALPLVAYVANVPTR